MNEELKKALEIVLEDLTHNNNHTIAWLVEQTYDTEHPEKWDTYINAYKLAQFEIFGTR